MSRQEACKLLGLVEPFTEKDLKLAYKRLSKQYHPDMPNGDNTKFKLVVDAYNLLLTGVKDTIVNTTNYTHYTIMDIVQI